MRLFSLLVAFPTALCAGPAVAGNLLVVDAAGGPGSDFTFLQHAIDAAGDGDIILVRDGIYSGATIVDTALTIAAEAGASVETTQPVTIDDLALGKSATFSGLSMRSIAFGPSFVARDCAGAVLVQDCEVRILDSAAVVSGDAAQVLRCGATTFVRCDITGESSSTPFLTGSGLVAVDSDVAIHDSTVRGPAGMQGDPGSGTNGAQGGSAIALTGGSLALYGTDVTGGTGGAGGVIEPFGLCTDAGPGGAALSFFQSVTTGDPLVRHTGTTLSGGVGGEATLGCANGGPGAALQGTGSLVVLPVAPRTYAATTPVRDGEVFVSTYAGTPGDFTFGLFTLDALPTPFVLELNGSVFPSLFTAQVSTVGVLPASGSANTTFTVSFAGVGAEVFVQGLFVGADLQAALSNPQSILFLGP